MTSALVSRRLARHIRKSQVIGMVFNRASQRFK